MPKPIYVPILKWKKGELDAMTRTFPQDRTLALPLLEFLEDTLTEEEDLSASPPQTPYPALLGRVQSSWGSAPIFIDMEAVDLTLRAAGGVHPLVKLFQDGAKLGLKMIPVTGVGRDPAFQQAVATIMASDRRGVCVRLRADQLFGRMLPTQLTAVLATLSCRPGEIDLLLDFGAVGEDEGSRTALGVSALAPLIPHLNLWRSVVVAASSFPNTLAAAGHGRATIWRAEWEAYQLLLASPPGGRLVSYGDYAIAYPVYDPAPFPGAAALRYTIDDEWLIYRGHSVVGPRHGGFAQFPQLCQQLIQDKEYRGTSFSWGDDYIDKCAKGQVGPGNMTTWRAVGTNHHLAFVARQLASYSAPSSGAVPQPVGP